MCKYALAHHLWLGRWDPLFRNANLSHQMLLALARIVTTKVVLRPEGRTTTRSGEKPSWDFLFHQSGMIGSAILFGNASCTKALESFPPQSVSDSFAVSFVARPPEEHQTGCPDGAMKHEGLAQDAQRLQEQAQTFVKGIAKLKVDRAVFEEQAAALRATNVVYKTADILLGLVCFPCVLNNRSAKLLVAASQFSPAFPMWFFQCAHPAPKIAHDNSDFFLFRRYTKTYLF